MKMNLKNSLILIFMTIGIMSSFCQKPDTTFYAEKKIRSIQYQKDGEVRLLKFFSENGENLLTDNKFHYENFDLNMGMSRIVDVANNKIVQEYWVSGVDTIYNNAKFEPDFDKKIEKFFRYISNNTVYPSEALEKQIQGKVVISFIVDKTGMITQIKPLTNIGFGLENESIELLKKYKKWGVLYLNSRPINCYFTLPFTYRL